MPHYEYDVYLILRPDLYYHDDFSNILGELRGSEKKVLSPTWQKWGGYNDRFICTNSREIAEDISNRFDKMIKFCSVLNTPFHSEQFIKWILDESKHEVSFVKNRASRVRADGTIKKESFSELGNLAIVRYLKFHLGRLKDGAFQGSCHL